MDRREFLENLVMGAGGSAACLAVDGILRGVANPDAWSTLTKFIPIGTSLTERIPSEHLKAAKTLFGDRGELLNIVGGRAHYQYPKTMHPDDRWACEVVGQYAEQLAAQHEIEAEAAKLSSDGSFICTGSPVSNAWSRAFLQYTYVDQSKPGHGLYRLPHPALDLPFEFELRPEVIRRSTNSKLHGPEAGKQEWNWSIRDRSGHLFVPSTSGHTSDLLLVSRIPNWLELRRPHKEFNNSVTIFAGTHGVGTSSVRLLLGDHELLKNLLLKTSQYQYWQALFTIDGMQRDVHPHSKAKRLIATSINRHFQCEPVNV